jgi:hypothetical protein
MSKVYELNNMLIVLIEYYVIRCVLQIKIFVLNETRNK